MSKSHDWILTLFIYRVFSTPFSKYSCFGFILLGIRPRYENERAVGNHLASLSLVSRLAYWIFLRWLVRVPITI